MPALIKLTAGQQDQLKELLNDLNRGLARIRFGDLFVSWLNGEKVVLTHYQQYPIKKLLNNLNIKARKVRLGDLMLALFDDSTKASILRTITDRQIKDVRRVFDCLNLDIKDFGLAQMMTEVVSGPTTRVAAISAAIDKYDGDTVDVTTLFRVVGGKATYKATGKGSLAGDIVTFAGTGSSSITATLAGADGSPATVTVTVKARPTLAAVAATKDLAFGSTLPVADLFTATGGTPNYSLDKTDFVTLTNGTLSTVAPGDTVVTATLADATGSPASVTLKVPAPKTVTGKGTITHAQGDVIPDTELFTYGNKASKTDVTEVKGTGVTWDDAAKKLTIKPDAPVGDIALTVTVKAGVQYTGTLKITGLQVLPLPLKSAGTGFNTAMPVSAGGDTIRSYVAIDDPSMTEITKVERYLHDNFDYTFSPASMEALWDQKSAPGALMITPIAGKSGAVDMIISTKVAPSIKYTVKLTIA